MLESLGYAEVPERDDADLILFNTCSIREKADERFVAHLHEAKGAQARATRSASSASAAAGRSRSRTQVFRAVPVRRRRLRPRPGPQARRVPDQRLAHRPGLLRVRGLHRPPAAPSARATFQAWVQISAGCNMKLLVLHRADHARPRGLAAARGARRRGRARWPPTASREVTLLGQNVNSYGTRLRPQPRRFSELLDAVDAIDGHRPHPLHEPAPRAHARGRHPRPRRAAVASASTSTCRCSPAARAILKAMRRTYDRERYLDRVALIREHVPDCAHHDRHHRRLPGGDRGGLRGDARGRRGGRLRRRLHVHLLAAARHRGGDASPTTSSRTRSRSSAWSGSSRSSSAAPASARSGSSAARSTCSSRAPSRTDPRACAAARATTRSSTSTASRHPARSCRSRSPAPRARRSTGEMSLLARAAG